MNGHRPRAGRWLAAVTAGTVAAATMITAGAGAVAGAAPAREGPSLAAAAPRYTATIVRTAGGIPHITARDFGSLGFGYGDAFASDDLCTMARGYVTVEGQRARYFGPRGSYPDTLTGDTIPNLSSDFFWRSVADRHVIARLLAVRRGPGAVAPQVRELMAGYVAGYNHYLSSARAGRGGAVPSCIGRPWVKPITLLDAYLRLYQIVDLAGQAAFINEITAARPPAPGAHGAPPVSRPAAMRSPASGPAGASGPASVSGLTRGSGLGSNAIAIGSSGARDGYRGMLLGNPHFPWNGTERLYQAQLTIPGTMNVEGASLYGMPLILVGFTSSMAWSHTVSTALPDTPYQLRLVPGHPAEYLAGRRPVRMTSRRVTVESRLASGRLTRVRHTFWFTRYGPVLTSFNGIPMRWTRTTAYALADANAGNFRFLNHYLATDRAQSVAQELSALRRYEGVPWTTTLAADSAGQALYADIQATPHVTDAEAHRCDTAIGAVTFRAAGIPVLDGSRPSCGWGTDRDSAVRGIFGGREQPALLRRDFVENSNDSYWLSNPAHPLTGFPRIMGDTGTDRGLRTRSALAMVLARLRARDGRGPAGFTLGDLQHLMYSDIQYGASLVKPQLVAMCRSLPGGRAPAGRGATVAVGNACRVLAAWNGRENPGSRGAVLFRAFWERALALPGGPWLVPFRASDPVGTPSGLDTARPAVRRAFGAALATLAGAHLPPGVPLRRVQFVVRDGHRIPLPGGPGDPDGEFNAIDEDALGQPGADPSLGSSYIQAVAWKAGRACPLARTVLTYSESVNPRSAHYADQTVLFSRRQWLPAYFCGSQVAAHALATTVVRS